MSLSTCSANSVSAISSPACGHAPKVLANCPEEHLVLNDLLPGQLHDDDCRRKKRLLLQCNVLSMPFPTLRANYSKHSTASSQPISSCTDPALRAHTATLQLRLHTLSKQPGDEHDACKINKQAPAHQEGAESQGEPGDLCEHRGAQNHQQSGGGKHVRVAHVCHAPVDRAQQRAASGDDHADARHSLRQRQNWVLCCFSTCYSHPICTRFTWSYTCVGVFNGNYCNAEASVRVVKGWHSALAGNSKDLSHYAADCLQYHHHGICL